MGSKMYIDLFAATPCIVDLEDDEAEGAVLNTVPNARLPKIGQTDKALQTYLLLVESSSATNNIVGFEACLRTRFEVSFQIRFEAVAQTGPVGAPCFKPGLKAVFKPLGLPVR